MLLFWCLWLLGSWVVTLTLYGAVPAVRWMMIACLVGYSLIWPVLRLSQADLVGAKPEGRIASNWRILWRIWRDWLSLFVILQAVVWPLRVTAHWSLEQTGWLIGGLGGWSLLIGAIIAWGCLSPRAWRRMTGMALCVLVFLGEPAWIGLVGSHTVTWEPIFSPLALIWHLAGPPMDWSAHLWSGRVTALCMAAVALWVLLLVYAGWPRRHRIADDPLSVSR